MNNINVIKHRAVLLATLSMLLSSPSTAQFYTIIGPDGFPIVLQQSQHPKKDNVQVKAATAIAKPVAEPITVSPMAKPVAEPTTVSPMAKPVADQAIAVPVQSIPPQAMAEQPRPISAQRATASEKKTVALQDKATALAPFSAAPVEKTAASTLTAQPNQMAQVAVKTSQRHITIPKAESVTATSAVPAQTASTQNLNFTEIDGVQYINNEYLEEREFNLEGKKRFYMVPESGASGAKLPQTIEREKGLTESIIGKLRKKDDATQQPLVLAPSYYRMPKPDVINALEQGCFSGKKLDKAKTIGPKNNEIVFWPTAPIKEKFVYEIAKLDPNTQEFSLRSYASSNKAETYYWPLVVFLDQQGCVVEGVSGFKNQQSDAKQFQYASIEGVLKKPADAVYMFMTPLASATDVDSEQLSNQGQIKLSLIR